MGVALHWEEFILARESNFREFLLSWKDIKG